MVQHIANHLRKSGKELYLVVNKTDGVCEEVAVGDFMHAKREVFSLFCEFLPAKNILVSMTFFEKAHYQAVAG